MERTASGASTVYGAHQGRIGRQDGRQDTFGTERGRRTSQGSHYLARTACLPAFRVPQAAAATGGRVGLSAEMPSCLEVVPIRSGGGASGGGGTGGGGTGGGGTGGGGTGGGGVGGGVVNNEARESSLVVSLRVS